MNDNDAVSGDQPECAASISGGCLAVSMNDGYCGEGECIHGPQIDTDLSSAARFERERRERTKAWITACRTQLGKDGDQ